MCLKPARSSFHLKNAKKIQLIKTTSKVHAKFAPIVETCGGEKYTDIAKTLSTITAIYIQEYTCSIWANMVVMSISNERMEAKNRPSFRFYKPAIDTL